MSFWPHTRIVRRTEADGPRLHWLRRYVQTRGRLEAASGFVLDA